MPGSNQNSPLNILTFGDIYAKLAPDVEDGPPGLGREAYYLDTYRDLKEGDIVGVYNHHKPLFTIGWDGHVIFGGNVTIPGTVFAAPLVKPFDSLQTWVWDHNLGYMPLTQVFNEEDKIMLSSVQHVSLNRLVVEHTSTRSGSIHIR